MGTDASFPQWLWDLLPQRKSRRPCKPARPSVTPSAKPNDRYAELVSLMKQRHGIRINRWRKSNSGCAWEVLYRDGSISRLIEAPYPRGPISCAVFLHEVGHHAIGFHRYKPRCYEEYMAWQWALEQMREHGVSITPRVEKRVDEALRYAVAKALRRRIKRLPVELVPYLPAHLQPEVSPAPSELQSV